MLSTEINYNYNKCFREMYLIIIQQEMKDHICIFLLANKTKVINKLITKRGAMVS